jgi:hypothetical protein
VLVVLSDERVDALARAIHLLTERRAVDVNARDRRETFEQGHARRGVGHRRDVVRHLSPQSDRRQADLAGPPLDGGLHARGHIDRGAHHPVRDEQRIACGDGQLRGTRVWYRCRVRTEADHQTRPEFHREIHDAPSEGAPRVIGLGADQQQQVVAIRVARCLQLDGRPGESTDDAINQVHRRAAGAVIEQLVAVEDGDGGGVEPAQQRGPRVGGAQPCVDPAVEGQDKDGRLEIRTFDELEQAHVNLSAAALAASARRTVCVANASNPAAGLPIAPCA